MNIAALVASAILTLGVAAAAGGAAPARPEGARAAAAPIDLETLRKLRKEAAHRRRRIIFNNDGDDVIYTKKEPTAEALLALRTAPLLGSQVDSIFYSNSLCFGHALHRSRVFEPFTNTDYFKENGLPQLIERGLAPIAIMADFCHAHGMEIFWDMRMNDTHDSMIGGYGPPLRPKLKREHPEWLVGSEQKMPPHGTWSSVDYAVPEVRDLAYRFFEEVCREFDVDGVEMDFFRHACYFKSVAWGGKASQAERDAMTDLIRRIRAMTEREGMRRGRPILIAIRVPDSVEYCRDIGLDVEQWLSEGLVDLLSGTCYFKLNPWEYLVDLGHRYGVPVYPSLSDSRVKGETRFQRNSLESRRGEAMQMWAAGADGIYLFNYFNPRGEVWRELGDPEGLRSRDKLYFVSTRNGSPDSYLAGGRNYQRVPILTPENPWLAPREKPAAVEIRVGDDLAAAARSGLKPSVTCHVRTLGGSPVAVSVNGRDLEKPAVRGEWLDFPVPPECVRKGPNRVAFRAAGEAPSAGEGWSFIYDGAKLPEAPWRKEGFVTGCVAEVRDGKLLLADRSTESGSYAYVGCSCFIPPDEECVVEARAKLLSGWSSVIVENGTAGEEICLYPDQVKARRCGVSAPVNTTDDFHTYRITATGKDFRVFVDGKLLLDGAGRLTHPAPNGRSGVMFGGANSPGLGEALWESVKVRNPAVTVLDLLLGVRY